MDLQAQKLKTDDAEGQLFEKARELEREKLAREGDDLCYNARPDKLAHLTLARGPGIELRLQAAEAASIEAQETHAATLAKARLIEYCFRRIP